MKKNDCQAWIINNSSLQKVFRIMKTTLFLILIATTSVFAEKTYSQTKMLNLSMQNSTLKEVLSQIEDQSEFYFMYSEKVIDVNRKVTIKVENEKIRDILSFLFDATDVNYLISDRIIVLTTPEVYGDFAMIEAQPPQVSGTVTDEYGNPVIGATVMIKGTTTGTITNNQGMYSLSNIPGDAVLIFSYVGMLAQEVPVDGKSTIDITMKVDAIGIEEVVAIGYGTMKKSDLTGSVSQVKAEELSRVSSANVGQALQGRVAGVTVMSDNRPGFSPKIRIRGNTSINADNSPLYVVDGFPLVDANISNISANDIESLEILKDASSTAIYGSRGANGVVLITTKHGIKGQKNFSVNSYVGVQTPARLIETLGRDEFISYINEAYTYQTGKPVYSDSNPAPDINTDWQDEILRDQSIVQEHTFTFDGGNEKTTYMLSGGLYSQPGMRLSSSFDRLTVRSNIEHKFSNWLTVGSNMQFSYSARDDAEPVANVSAWPHGIFVWGWPTIPVKNEDGSWHYGSEDPLTTGYIDRPWNPVASASQVTSQTDIRRFLSDFFAKFTLAKGLTFKSYFGADLANSKDYLYYTSKYEDFKSLNGSGQQDYDNRITKISENILNYTNTWGGHRLTAIGVYSYQDYMYENIFLSGTGWPNDITGANNMKLADAASINYGTNKYSSKLISWTARVSYAYNDKYLLTATGRYDGSSRFGENNKWGFFPSAGIAWRISNEDFLEDNVIISNLKLRASYGITGNQEIGNYASLPKLGSVNYVYNDVPIQGFQEGIGNPDLRWEKTAQYNIGLDITLWNRLDIVMDYYNQNTSDLIYYVPIPTTSGYGSMLQNIGGVENQGFEFTANARVLDRELKWDMNVNFSTNKNQITELYGDVEEIIIQGGKDRYRTSLKVGKPVNAVYVRKFEGIITTQEQLDAYREIRSDAQLGEEMYADINGDNIISGDDYVLTGTTEPEFFYGISTSLYYKDFSLDITGQGATGIANTRTDYVQTGEHQMGIHIPTKYAYDRMWREDNPNGTFPRPGARGSQWSTATSGNSEYFIIKNIKLSYNLKSALLQNQNWCKSLTIYANAQNFINYANFRGYNPENGDSSNPYIKALIFGLNVKF